NLLVAPVRLQLLLEGVNDFEFGAGQMLRAESRVVEGEAKFLYSLAEQPGQFYLFPVHIIQLQLGQHLSVDFEPVTPGQGEDLAPVSGILMPPNLLNPAQTVSEGILDFAQVAVARRQLFIKFDRSGPLAAFFQLFSLLQQLLKRDRVGRIVRRSPELASR